jgi:putative tryptophan/tyrosine transport system substrate-binding protein
MRRREFITLLGGALAGWPFAAAAQQGSVSRPLIGVLSPVSAAAAAKNMAAFRSALRDLGFVEGGNARLAVRYGAGEPERMAPLAAELVALSPDVIVAAADSGALAARDATRTIPVVVIIAGDPVAMGLAQTIARPGGNITGSWLWGDDALVGKRLQLLRLAVPALSRVAVLVNPDDPNDMVSVPPIPAAGRALGIAIEVVEVRDVRKLDEVSEQLARAGAQALFVAPGPTFFSARAEITAWAARLKLPAVYGYREFTDAGGLMSYGPSLPDIYRQSAKLAGKILKGERAADLPFELPTRYELVLNLKAAKALGLTILDSFVLLADEVIE